MKPVAYDCANDGAGDGGEVEEPWSETKASLLTYEAVASEKMDVPRL